MDASRSALALFDLDGTLTMPRKVIEDEVKTFLLGNLKQVMALGIVGGSNLCKIAEQLGGMDVVKQFDYVFPENGLVALKNGEIFAKQNLAEHLGEPFLTTFIDACLAYMAQLSIPIKRGTFIEYRCGLLNVCPIGRNCSQKERDEFEQYDKVHNIRSKFISHLKEKFPSADLQYAIGGQISFDVFPIGWDKSYCLQFLSQYKTIYFFGDRCDPGGNDYEIFSSPLVKGNRVNGPNDTMKLLKELYSTHYTV